MKETKISKIRNLFGRICIFFKKREKGDWHQANSVRQGVLAVRI